MASRTPRSGSTGGQRPPGTSPGTRGPSDTRAPSGTSGSRRPRPSRATIMKRRIVALIVLLLVLALAAFVVTRLVRAVGTMLEPEADPTPVATDTGPDACPPGDIELATRAAEATEGEGGDVVVTVTNAGSRPCLLEAGREHLTLDVSSGGQPVWSSVACEATPRARPLLLDAESSSDVTLAWDGTNPGESCGAGRPDADPGTYRYVVALDGRFGDESTVVLTAAPEPGDGVSGAPSGVASSDPEGEADAEPSGSPAPSTAPSPTGTPTGEG